MAKKAESQNFDPAAVEKIAVKAKKDIFAQIDNINSARAASSAKTKVFNEKIRAIKAAAKDDGVSMGVLNEAIQLEKAARAQANRQKKMEPDDLRTLKKSKGLKPSNEQFQMFFAAAEAAPKEPAETGENVTQLRK